VATVTRRNANLVTFKEGGERTFFRRKSPVTSCPRQRVSRENTEELDSVFTGMMEEAWPVRILRRGAENWCG
jgi:hypothetical protein